MFPRQVREPGRGGNFLHTAPDRPNLPLWHSSLLSWGCLFVCLLLVISLEIFLRWILALHFPKAVTRRCGRLLLKWSIIFLPQTASDGYGEQCQVYNRMDLDKYLTMCPFFSQLNQYRLRILTSDYHQRLSEQGDTLRWSHSNTKSFVPQSFPIAQKTTLWWQNENSTKSKDCNGCQ